MGMLWLLKNFSEYYLVWRLCKGAWAIGRILWDGFRPYTNRGYADED